VCRFSFAPTFRLAGNQPIGFAADGDSLGLLRRLAHPFWFQSLGAVMGMDWHSSGITTTVVGALKRGLAPLGSELGVHVCPIEQMTNRGETVAQQQPAWAQVCSSSAAPRQARPDRDERRINNERSQDCGVGRRDHAADTRGETPTDEPGCERECDMTW
jgi:hypothetical protein